MDWGGGELEKLRRGQLYFALFKISFHILQIKRAAAPTHLQHLKKVWKKHIKIQY